MKVIGEGQNGTYICEVQHTEIEKFMDLYYHKMDRLKIGDEIDFGEGYDFAQKAQSAYESMRKLVEDNKQVIKAIIKGVSVLGGRK